MRAQVWGAVLLASGCVAPAAVPPDAAVVRVEAKPGIVAPPARGETQLVVRAVPADTQGAELRGVACAAETPWFRAQFTTPARLLFPDYGASAPPVVVTCRNGAASGTATAQPQAAWSGGLSGWPAVGISVGTGDVGGVGVGLGWYGGNVGAASGVPVVTYPELQVVVQ